jgi:hypothetical protein
LTVWDAEHPSPPGGSAVEQRLLDWLARDSDQQMAELAPRDRESLDRYRGTVGTAWRTLVRGLPEDAGAKFHSTVASQRDDRLETLGFVRYGTIEGHRAELPCIRFTPSQPNGRTVIWIDERGKSGLYDGDGALQPQVVRLLNSGLVVVGVDLLAQGEFLIRGQAADRQRSLPGEEAFAGWTYCYNLPLIARRAQDILAVIAACKSESPAVSVELVGFGRAGVWAALALALADGTVERAAIDTGGFRFAKLTDVYDADFLPGAVKYGDVPGLLALAAPTKLWLAGEGESPAPVVAGAYQAAGKPGNLTVAGGQAASNPDAAVRRLLTAR